MKLTIAGYSGFNSPVFRPCSMHVTRFVFLLHTAGCGQVHNPPVGINKHLACFVIIKWSLLPSNSPIGLGTLKTIAGADVVQGMLTYLN